MAAPQSRATSQQSRSKWSGATARLIIAGVLAILASYFVASALSPKGNGTAGRGIVDTIALLSQACRELDDLDARLSGHPPDHPYDKDPNWDLTWKPSRPELQQLSSTVCRVREPDDSLTP